MPGAVGGFSVFYLGLDELEKCAHGGEDPLVLVPEDVRADIEGGGVPVEGFGLVLAGVRGGYDGGGESEGPFQWSALNWFWRSSRATTMAGSNARPIPAETHCLMASTLENSVMWPGRMFCMARTLSSLAR